MDRKWVGRGWSGDAAACGGLLDVQLQRGKQQHRNMVYSSACSTLCGRSCFNDVVIPGGVHETLRCVDIIRGLLRGWFVDRKGVF